MPFNIIKHAYTMASTDGRKAEITLYGDVVETQPVNWTTGQPIDGDFIIQDEFLNDLEAVKDCSEVTVRINSYGGDTVVGLLIHNRLRELARDGVKLTAIIDGVAMSAASIIMCACDTVRVNPTALIMVHKNSVLLLGFYNADEIRRDADTLDTYDKAIVEAYTRKTGLPADKVLGMLADTTYMTGREAVEKGFADELIEDAKKLNIAASANGSALYVDGARHQLPPGLFAPDFIPTAKEEPPAAAPARVEDKTAPETHGAENGGSPIMTQEELRALYPEQVAAIEAAAAERAVATERARMQGIEEIAPLYDSALVLDAKYGENPCDAAALALRAAKDAAKKGGSFLAAVTDDANASGVNDVPPAHSENEVPVTDAGTVEDAEAAGAAAAQDFMKNRGGK